MLPRGDKSSLSVVMTPSREMKAVIFSYMPSIKSGNKPLASANCDNLLF